MKLQKKLISYFLVISIIIMTILTIIFNISFNNNLDRYLDSVRTARFNEIIQEINDITKKSSINFISPYLETYAKIEKIKVELIDNDGNNIISFNGLESGDKLVNTKFDLMFNSYKIGYVQISYYEDSAIDSFASNFKNSFLQSIFLAFIITLIVGSIFYYILSKNITYQIGKIESFADSLRLENYDIKPLETSNIEEFKSLEKNMNYLKDSLAIEEESRRKYAEDISHELRTPLTNIKIQIEAMMDGIIEKDDKNLNSINEEIDHLTLLIKELKESFNKSKKVRIKLEEFNIKNLLENLAIEFSSIVKNRNINFTYEIEDNLMYSDKAKIHRCVYNLLSNAYKACRENGFIKLNEYKKDDYIFIEVSDNGIGIKEEDKARIFDRLFRAERSRNKDLGGSGLGLSIVKNLLNSIDSEIYFESELNKGSKFIIKTPIRQKVKNKN
ncbi:HAMP domain-containing sensor histidine kinase [Citroniella saccharovorans]|uniref:histidine kinase n=1 Tax=Citroniella saccharovorans TaxID=2053367 RepID=A0AAW9MR18_9FIRM|nr:HAMP domain-containing sensor histidine kinase [Citroniella saccharovorans]MEB3429574.1 HAMP domain-containing sensor histidine kinase [Citroniella saccharovorans]